MGIGPPAAGILFHELVGSREARTGDALADAAREQDADVAERGRRGSAGPGAARPLLGGTRSVRASSPPLPAHGRATSIHVAEGKGELALLRDGTGRWVAVLERMGVAAARMSGPRPWPPWPQLGAFDGDHPPLLVHMVHAERGGPRASPRVAGAPAVLCPRSNLHVGGLLPDVAGLLAVGAGHGARHRQPRVVARYFFVGRDGDTGGASSLCPGGPLARRRHPRRRPRPRAWGLGALAPGNRPGLMDVPVEDAAAPVASLVRDPRPSLRWMARA